MISSDVRKGEGIEPESITDSTLIWVPIAAMNEDNVEIGSAERDSAAASIYRCFYGAEYCSVSYIDEIYEGKEDQKERYDRILFAIDCNRWWRRESIELSFFINALKSWFMNAVLCLETKEKREETTYRQMNDTLRELLVLLSNTSFYKSKGIKEKDLLLIYCAAVSNSLFHGDPFLCAGHSIAYATSFFMSL